MCGICGIIGKKLNRSDRDKAVQEMNHSILHRGPDEDGFYSDENCSLAMRRLSIIDLSTGKQPIFSNSGRSLIFFNGEIYNYPELKDELLAKGVQFSTHSDTEVLVNLFEQYGTDMLLKLRGMFAFCIYDSIKNEYFFARDRFGEKPFFYYHQDNNFFFSSELSSLVSCKSLPRKLNHSLLGTYLQRSFIPEPYTLFKDIMSLPPGCCLILNNSITVNPYFKVDYKPDTSIKTIRDAADFVKPYLYNAVQRQMISDVPIGAFLSGGIDSSTVVALMQRFSDKKIRSFNVKFQTQGYDESQIARKVAERVGTDHHEIIVENNTFEEAQFWKILRHTGIPFPDSSAIPTDIVTRSIVKYVKVALSGDGGDELFAGYDVYDWVTKINKLKTIPTGLRKMAGSVIRQVNATSMGNNRLRQIGKAVTISQLKLPALLEEMHALFDSKELEELYEKIPASKINDEVWSRDWSIIRKAMYYRVKYDLPLDMLTKVDRMSMSNSLEVRNPFLDPDLFDASSKLPDQFLRKKGIGKLVIREIMKNMLPVEVFEHPKSGFSIPLHDFKNAAFVKLAHELLLNQDYMYRIFNPQALKEIVAGGLNETKNSNTGSIYRKTHQLWSLMMFSGWIKMYDVEV